MVRVQGGYSVAAEPLLDRADRRHAVAGPRAPGVGGRGQAESPPVVGQSIEVSVAGRVVALAGDAQDTGEG